jgi:hypothetical protein
LRFCESFDFQFPPGFLDENFSKKLLGRLRNFSPASHSLPNCTLQYSTSSDFLPALSGNFCQGGNIHRSCCFDNRRQAIAEIVRSILLLTDQIWMLIV